MLVVLGISIIAYFLSCYFDIIPPEVKRCDGIMSGIICGLCTSFIVSFAFLLHEKRLVQHIEENKIELWCDKIIIGLIDSFCTPVTPEAAFIILKKIFNKDETFWNEYLLQNQYYLTVKDKEVVKILKSITHEIYLGESIIRDDDSINSIISSLNDLFTKSIDNITYSGYKFSFTSDRKIQRTYGTPSET